MYIDINEVFRFAFIIIVGGTLMACLAWVFDLIKSRRPHAPVLISLDDCNHIAELFRDMEPRHRSEHMHEDQGQFWQIPVAAFIERSHDQFA